MPLPPVVVEDIDKQLIASIESKISQTIPLVSKAYSRVVSKGLAGLIVLLFSYNQYTFLQMFVSSASNKATTIFGRTLIPLQEWGLLVGAGLPRAATAAEFNVDATVFNITGNPLESGAQLVSGDNGITYLTTATVLLNAAVVTIPVVAAADQSNNSGVGGVGNLDEGAIVSFVTTPPGVLQDAVVADAIVTGVDGETEDAYRDRVTDRFQKRPQGGALTDYDLWGTEAEGIINVYPYKGPCPGIVQVYCEATELSSGSADGFPTDPQLDDVLAEINLDVNGRATRRPVGVFVEAFSITRKPFEVVVNGLEVSDSVNVQTRIAEGLDTYFRSLEPYIGGVSVIRRDRVTHADVGGKVSDIVKASGGVFAAIILRSKTTIVQTFSGRVVASSDDAEEVAGVVTLNNPSLSLGGVDSYTGIRIDQCAIPTGSTVLSATLTLEASVLNNTYSDFEIRAEANVLPPTYTVAANDISSRSLTVANTSWVPAGWPLDSQNVSPDLTDIVQEVVNIDGWVTGNPMNFVLVGSDDSDRDVKSFEVGLVFAPLLTVEYSVEAVNFTSIQVYTLARGEKAKLEGVSFT